MSSIFEFYTQLLTLPTRNLDRLFNRHFRKPSPLSLSLKKGEGVLIGHFPLLLRGEDSPRVIKE